MIDLHSHILPGIDDGAKDMNMSIEMARMAVADGTTHIACTPHIMPTVYDNNSQIIAAKLKQLHAALLDAGIDLKLIMGADVHVAPDLVEKLGRGIVPTLGGTRYFLFEPPHHVLPPTMNLLARKLMKAGYIPILTHPERLTWIETNYEEIQRLDEAGILVQITGASITGRFGDRAQYWSERMLDEGRVDIVASDAHNVRGRTPILSEARVAVGKRIGEAAAERIFNTNPAAIMANQSVAPKKRSKIKSTKPAKKSGSRLIDWFKSS